MKFNRNMFYDKKPIISYGIICYKVDKTGTIEYLLIQRKDTIGYTDLIRGKYTVNKENNIKTFIEEMTEEEKHNIISMPFDYLWCCLFLDHNSKLFINSYYSSKNIFNSLNLKSYIDLNEPSRWNSTEWGFAKGRKSNSQENGYNCALREFHEESGYNKEDYISNKFPYFIEEFMGSNGLYYKHIYYLAKLTTNKNPAVDNNNVLQIGEVKQIGFFNYIDAMNKFRIYNTEKEAY